MLKKQLISIKKSVIKFNYNFLNFNIPYPLNKKNASVFIQKKLI
jgi:hypothetical protein